MTTRGVGFAQTGLSPAGIRSTARDAERGAMRNIVATTLVREGHVRSFQVRTAHPAGWETVEHEDRRVVRQQRYFDWHRLERTLDRFAREIAYLRERGWRET